MCRTCWFSVPAKLRKAVNGTWRAYRMSMSERKEVFDDYAARIEAYRVARDAAIAAAVVARP
jgi:hypothetical protein